MIKRILILFAATTFFLPTICMEKKSEQIKEITSEKLSNPTMKSSIIYACIAKKNLSELCNEEFDTIGKLKHHLRKKHKIFLTERNKNLYSCETEP